MNVPPGVVTALPIIALLVGFAAFCVVDLVRASQVRYLPKWGWALLICLWVP